MKIVINTRHGGFSLSPKAVLRLAELQGKQCFFYNSEGLDIDQPVPIGQIRSFNWLAYSIPDAHQMNEEETERHFLTKHPENRTDPLLIQVVEELGVGANGNHACLKIIDIPDDIEYTIEEYDGKEWIAEVHRTWQ
jgi:hypothetical protein